ncbi:hypothetical protein BVRB_5g110150 [Beta vulgaris subsp. vulgaris]|uniref:Purple acid phosphatase Fn3-like domain-containing protein n=1 Tax=Beta vulgaris subsp. vulgaris TaxID=3555 RepID=A0A0J8F5P2_BETVV|nr:hypothetical protein BVRB_5g110150 [Beta vulgaris subsp. vulgaris]
MIYDGMCIMMNLGEDAEWIDINLCSPNPTSDDWIGVFSPANFNSSNCHSESDVIDQVPYICSTPIKYMFANTNNSVYTKNGKATLRFLLINQRADFSFALFSGGLSNPKVVAVSNSITFANPKAPLYPRLALGKSWDEIPPYAHPTVRDNYDVKESFPSPDNNNSKCAFRR